MRKTVIKIIQIACLSILTITWANCQTGIFDNSNDELYRRAYELFEKQKYAAAQKFFIQITETPQYNNTIQKSNAQYYATICAIELFNDDAEVLGQRFINENPESPKVNDINFRLAKYKQNNKKYKSAIGYFLKVNKDLLEDNDRAEYFFKMGYSWFMTDSLDKARICFYEIKDIDTKYTSAALYYYSHIAYIQKKFETAIAGFIKLKDEEEFANIVPYYITQCYYYQEKYDELINYAPALMDSVIPSRVAEMAKMIGDAYYRKNKLNEAIPYLEKYVNTGKDVKAAEYYQLGYCYYQFGKYDEASKMFEKASEGNSIVAQNANYHLGDCYIRLDEKQKAMMAFSAAAKSDSLPRIKEDALFNYSVLSYELSSSPFNDAIKALNDYILQYPESKRSDEAYQYLTMAYLNTRNYQNALVYIEKIKNKDKNIKKAYQRIAFFRGLELYNNLQFNDAIKTFEVALKYAEFDSQIAARTNYWMAESNYRIADFDMAIENFNLFIASPQAVKCDENKLVNYNMGYCWFNKKQYETASTWFSKYIDANKTSKTKYVADSYNRIGDCSFMGANYQGAADCYSKSIELALSNKDYALYQKAFSLGLMGKHKQKITLLNQLITEYPQSAYVDDGLYEIGKSNMAILNNEEASKYFTRIVKDFPQGGNMKKALLQLGLIQYNSGKPNAALDTYKRIVSDYPGTQEAKSALTGIKNIYVDLNEVDAYISYTEKLGDFANISTAEQDSLTYIAAENLYTSGNSNKAKESFKKYIAKYPSGSFILNAQYYLGDCYMKTKEYNEALKAFSYVIERPKNEFSEQSLVAAAGINYQNANYKAAFDNYVQLENIAEADQNITSAKVGQMQCAYQLNDYAKALETAGKVLAIENLEPETERLARYISGKSYLEQNDAAKALEQFRRIAGDVKNVEGAEAKYQIANIYYSQGVNNKAEKEIFSFIDLNTPHQYWLAKAFILLSDVYMKKNDKYQAVNTLQSIIDNYDTLNDGIIDEAKAKKAYIEGTGTKPDSMKKQDDIEFKLK
jgi:TolA-binding protein